MFNMNRIKSRVSVHVDTITQLAKRAAARTAQKLQPVQQHITHSKVYQSIYQFGKMLIDEYRLTRYGAETLQAAGYYDKPHTYTVLPLQELLELQHADQEPQYQQFRVGEHQIPLQSVYIVIAEYRYCFRIFVGAVEELKYADGRTVTRGSAPLAEFIRPIDGPYNSWNIATFGSSDERLELAVATALNAIAPTNFGYTTIRSQQQRSQQTNQQERQEQQPQDSATH